MATTADLIQALAEGVLDRFRRILGESPGLARARDESGVSILLQARYRGRFDMVEALLEARGQDDIDVFEAAALGRLERLTRLVAQDPRSVHAHSADGFTPLQLATFFAEPDSVRVLLQRGANVEVVSQNTMALRAIHSASAGGSTEIVEHLLQAGADANSRQQGGWTPLHAAAAAGRLDMVRVFLAHGADPTLTNSAGKSAYDIALQKGHAAVVQALRGAVGPR